MAILLQRLSLLLQERRIFRTSLSDIQGTMVETPEDRYGGRLLPLIKVTAITHVKAAPYKVVPRSPIFTFCAPKYCRLQK